MELIKLTSGAVEKIKRLLVEHQLLPESAAIRVGIKGGGCSGFTYTFDFDKQQPTKFDYVIEADGVRVVIDKKSAIFLAGTELDYESTIMKSGFVFKNPNAKSNCGCGTSFAA